MAARKSGSQKVLASRETWQGVLARGLGRGHEKESQRS